MHLHYLTIFPHLFPAYLSTSIMRRAGEKGLFSYETHDIADYSDSPTRRVDDRPYGGGAGTLMRIEPLDRAIEAIVSRAGKKLPILIMAAHGTPLGQPLAQKFANELSDAIVVCGHYEGVDHRIELLHETIAVSVGDFVLSSGELAALVLTDSMVRLIPGVISPESLAEESFGETFDGKREYPQYTRPETYRDQSVPDVLLSGDHARIRAWQHDHLR